MEPIFMNLHKKQRNKKTAQTCYKLILDLRSSEKQVALQNLPIYYTWINIRQP